MEQFLGQGLADDFALISSLYGLDSSSTDVSLSLPLVNGVPQGTDSDEQLDLSKFILDHATPAALELAVSYLDDETLRKEAVDASARLAELLLPTHKEAAKQAMRRVLSKTDDKKLRARLERQINKP